MKPQPRPEPEMTPEMIHFAKLVLRMYAETHPRPSHVTQKQGAQMLGISAATMSRLVKFGTIKLDKCGMVPIGQIDEALTPWK